jgi:hypothetical protein
MIYKKITSSMIWRTALAMPLVLPAFSYAQTNQGGTVSITNATDSSTLPAPEKKPETVKDAVIDNKAFNRPIVEGKVSATLFTEDTFQGRGANQPVNNYGRAALSANVYATEDLYLSGNFRVSSPSNGGPGTFFFNDPAVTIAELAIRYDADNYSLVAGHTNINYSLARRYAAGIWGSTMARSEYGVDGMMVLGGQYKVNAGEFGNHSISANVFMVDNTFLSDQIGGPRNPTPLSLGGAGNTGKFNNFAVAIDGLKIKAVPKLRYQVAAVRMTTDTMNNKYTNATINPIYLGDEQRYLAAVLLDKLEVYQGIKVTPLVEYNRTINSIGISGFNKSYLTGSLLFTYKQWNLGLSGSVWDANWSKIVNGQGLLPKDPDFNDANHQLQVAVGYAFKNGIKANVGYRKENKFNNVTSQAVALVLSYDLPFAF